MITQVRAQFNGTWYTLTLNEATGYYETELPGVESSAGQPGKWYNVAVEGTNDRGNTTTRDGSTLSTLQRVVKEGTPPVLTLVSPAEGILDTGTPTIIFDAVDPGETASGIDPDTVKLELDGVQVPLTLSEIEGGYRATFTPDEAIPDGSHSFTATVYDNDGNGAVLSFGYTIDTTPPVIVIDWDSLRRVTDADHITVTGTITDATTGVQSAVITGGAEPVTITGGAFSVDVPLVKGVYDLTLTAKDPAGNVNSETWRVIRLVTWRVPEDAATALTYDQMGLNELTAEQAAKILDGMIGSYSWIDWDRVESATELLGPLLNAMLTGVMEYGKNIFVAMTPRWWPLFYRTPFDYSWYNLTVKTDWDASAEPGESQHRRYLKNATDIRNGLAFESPPLPESMIGIDTDDANAIEKGLVGADAARLDYIERVKEEMDLTALSLVYAGECWAGDGIT